MKLTDLLDEIQRLDKEATKGPWVAHPGVKYVYTTEAGMVLDRAWVDQPDADLHLAALARTALPKLAKALRAVLEVHQKTEHQRAYGFPKADKWEHYCIADNQSWPCDTHKAITDTLGDDDDQ